MLRAAFGHAVRKVVRATGGRPVPAHNFHATLLFLGSVAELRIPDLAAIAARAAASTSRPAVASGAAGADTVVPSMRAAADDASALQLVFDRIEFWEKSRVLVAMTTAGTGAGHAVAGVLAETLQRETIGAGFAPDLKPFRAHVTVARKVVRSTRSLDMHPVPWTFDGFALVESRTQPEGAVYSVIESYPLSKAHNCGK